jgi:hypothetical protein
VPSVAVLEELAPGRTLVQIVGGTHDGEMVVVMGAGGGVGVRTLSWYLDGDAPPELPAAPPPTPPPAPRRRAPTRRAEAKAGALLESLLSPRQLGEWRRDRCFWVSTPAGSVSLGRLYQLHFRPRPSGRELLLCVVPVEPERHPMPEADVWANLLLMLHDDPRRFFATANWRYVDGGNWQRAPAPVPTPASPRRRSGEGPAALATRGRSPVAQLG